MPPIVLEERPRSQGGPPLGVLALVSLLLLIAGLVASAALGGTFPSPFGDPATIQAYFSHEPDAVRTASVLLFGSSVPLVIYAATVCVRLRQLGMTAPGSAIALAGGVLAGGALASSGLLQWTLASSGVRDFEPVVRALQDLTFLSGGPAHVVFLGLLIAGIATPGLLLGLIPRPLAWAGLVIAGLAELSFFTLAWPALGLLVPLARFPGLLWLVAVGFLLPHPPSRTPSERTS
jgi:hypothetical protein